MENEKPLTIDPAATRSRILDDGRSVRGYGIWRGYKEGTACRIVNGLYPHNDNPNGVYQSFLRQLQKDGYLVQAGDQPTQSAAA